MAGTILSTYEAEYAQTVSTSTKVKGHYLQSHCEYFYYKALYP